MPKYSGSPPISQPGLVDKVVENVSKGMYPHVAAAALGIRYSTHRRWMVLGEIYVSAEEEGRDPYDVAAERYPAYANIWDHTAGQTQVEELKEYFGRVDKAYNETRGRMEASVGAIDPFKWLRYGPGRDRPNNPGWTDQQVVVGDDERPVQFKIEPLDYRQALSPLKPPDAEQDDAT